MQILLTEQSLFFFQFQVSGVGQGKHCSPQIEALEMSSMFKQTFLGMVVYEGPANGICCWEVFFQVMFKK